ncbi:fasciclin domain-containing protein [Jannaschia formosa]|uniref:fasciclin domain-containing protein n=1 Tax=Jannaschia formosa TaxID=2259592 RepID=UPI000E1BF6E9|nr:fasciclin domain-containing protein [Jannaschia formosa]TFL19990.1 fasciclin domain-containing protein [Jannaschia formosa]
MTRHALISLLSAGTLALTAPAFAQDAPPAEISRAVEAAETAGVLETILAGGEVTVFVPTNEALASAPQEVLGEVLGDPERLAAVIQGYAVEGTVMAADAEQAILAGEGVFEVESLGGTMLALTMDGDVISVAGAGETVALVVTPDIQFGNVTIHTIGSAILPGTPEDM